MHALCVRVLWAIPTRKHDPSYEPGFLGAKQRQTYRRIAYRQQEPSQRYGQGFQCTNTIQGKEISGRSSRALRDRVSCLDASVRHSVKCPSAMPRMYAPRPAHLESLPTAGTTRRSGQAAAPGTGRELRVCTHTRDSLSCATASALISGWLLGAKCGHFFLRAAITRSWYAWSSACRCAFSGERRVASLFTKVVPRSTAQTNQAARRP